MRFDGTVELLSTAKVRSVPSALRITSELALDETTVPLIVVESCEDCPCMELCEDWSCCDVPVVEPVWAASSPATPMVRAAPNRNA